MIDCARQRVSLYTKNNQIVYQASQNAIRPSPILRSFLGGRRQLETYSSLFIVDGNVMTGIGYPVLIVVDEFPYVFSDELLGLPPDMEIKFSIDLVFET